MRSATSDVLVRLTPPKELTLESAVEFLRSDESVEVTPESIRLRKTTLDATERAKAARRVKNLSR